MLKQKQKVVGEKSSILYYVAAGACILVGIVGLYFYSQTMGIGFAILTMMGLGGGGGIIYWQVKKAAYSGSNTINVAGKKRAALKLTDENCLNIYPIKDAEGKVHNEAIKFEKVPEGELQGHPWLFRANKQFYYLNRLELATATKVPYILKDGVFVDPVDLASALECRPVRKYLKHRDSLMKYVGPLVLIVAFIIECIMIIAMGG